MRHSEHEAKPAPLVKRPAAQGAHTRSDDAVATAAVCDPAGQGTRTAAHDSPFLVAENVTPAAQAAHCRSAVLEPAADMPEPAAHVAHLAHASLPAVALKWPGAHDAHVRSLDLVAARSMNSPAAHSPRIGAHAAPLSVPEYVAPCAHAAHWRSAASEPAAETPCPAGHVRHASQAWLPSRALNCPAAHVAHSRSDEAPGAVVSYLPPAHTAMWLHVRSAVPLGASDVYWPSGHAALCVLHERSEVSVGLAVSYSSDSHAVTAAQRSPLSADEKLAPWRHEAHSRFAVDDPATDMPSPMGHVRQATHVCSPATLVKWPAVQAAHVRSLDAVAAAAV